MDQKFTRRLQDYLARDRAERSLSEGADLLLALNRNRWLHQQILRRELWDKLEYELKKHLRIRLDGLTLDGVVRMEKEVVPKAKESVEAQFRGRRADHDQLPAKIQQLYADNGPRYERMKQLYNDLLRLADAEPCDRYELLKLLAELDQQYRQAWADYDAAKPAKKKKKIES